MLRKVIVRTVSNAPKFAPAERESELEVGRGAAVKAKFFLIVVAQAQVFFLEYYGLGRYLNWVITGMICVRALFSGWKYSGRALLLGLITVAGWLSGALLGGNMETFRANILLLLYPFVYTLYFFLLVTNKRDFLLGLFDAGFPVFNAILLLNMSKSRFQRLLLLFTDHFTISYSLFSSIAKFPVFSNLCSCFLYYIVL